MHQKLKPSRLQPNSGRNRPISKMEESWRGGKRQGIIGGASMPILAMWSRKEVGKVKWGRPSSFRKFVRCAASFKFLKGNKGCDCCGRGGLGGKFNF